VSELQLAALQSSRCHITVLVLPGWHVCCLCATQAWSWSRQLRVVSLLLTADPVMVRTLLEGRSRCYIV
jgi:hypothetical protein